MSPIDHSIYMKRALVEAQKAFDNDEVPIGAVIVAEKQIIARGYNQTQMLSDATAHAEMIALTAAMEYLNSKYLPQCTLYVTIEPCAMCAGALRWAQLNCVVFGAQEPKSGFSLYTPSILHPKTEVIGGVEHEACSAMIKNFFDQKRK